MSEYVKYRVSHVIGPDIGCQYIFDVGCQNLSNIGRQYTFHVGGQNMSNIGCQIDFM